MRKIVLSILVENTSGVLSRVSGLFSRRGYNIDSFSAGVTADSRITRMTIVTSGDEEILEQIEKQVEKLEEVLSVTKLDYMDSVFRELALVKVRSDVNSRRDIFAIADIFRAKIIDVGNDSVTIEITGTQDKLEAFLSLMKSHEILELARTGLTALSRGSENVLEVIPLLNKRYE
ncbi:acetolactate synthase small subunit [Acetitomaculum ruminis]